MNLSDQYSTNEARWIFDHYFHNLNDTYISGVVTNNNGLFSLREVIEKIPSLQGLSKDVLLSAISSSRFVSYEEKNNEVYIKKRSVQDFIVDHLDFWFGKNFERDYFLHNVISRNGGVAPIAKVANFGSFSLLELPHKELEKEIAKAATRCSFVSVDDSKTFLCKSNSNSSKSFSLTRSQQDNYQQERLREEEKQQEYQRNFQQQSDSRKIIETAKALSPVVQSTLSTPVDDERVRKQKAIEDRLAVLEKLLKEEEEKAKREKEDGKREDQRKDELRKEELRKEESRKEELRKEELKKELMKEELRKEDSKQSRKEELRKEILKKEELLKEELKREELKKELMKEELRKELKEELKRELMKEELRKELKKGELREKQKVKSKIDDSSSLTSLSDSDDDEVTPIQIEISNKRSSSSNSFTSSLSSSEEGD